MTHVSIKAAEKTNNTRTFTPNEEHTILSVCMRVRVCAVENLTSASQFEPHDCVHNDVSIAAPCIQASRFCVTNPDM